MYGAAAGRAAPRRREASVARALHGRPEEPARTRAHGKGDPRPTVGGREEELPLGGHRVLVERDLEGLEVVIGLHRMVYRPLHRHRGGVLGKDGTSSLG